MTKLQMMLSNVGGIGNKMAEKTVQCPLGDAESPIGAMT